MLPPKIYDRYTHTQKKNRKESKYNTKESHQITREENKRRRKEQKELQKQPQNNLQNGNKYIYIYQ